MLLKQREFLGLGKFTGLDSIEIDAVYDSIGDLVYARLENLIRQHSDFASRHVEDSEFDGRALGEVKRNGR